MSDTPIAPTTAPDWATDANYAAGSDPWSGTPTKSAPSAGKVQTGYVPNTDDAAEEDNFVLGLHGDWINYLNTYALGIGQKVYQENYQGYFGVLTSSQTPVTDYESISVSINGAGSQADFNSDDIGAISNYSGRMAVLTAGGANARYANVSTTRSSYDFTCTAMRLIYEQDIAIFDVTVGDYKIGLTDSATALTNFCGLRHLHTDTDWILSTALGTFTVPSSAPTDAVIQHFVIVYSGADTPEGIANSNTALIRVYLNGVLKLTQSGAFLATGNEYIIQDARATGAGGAFAIVGGWTLRWNAY